MSLIALNTLGLDANEDDVDCGDDDPNSPPYSSPYDDLAFEMYVDTEVADIIRQMEIKKHQAVKSKYKRICRNGFDIFFF